jgi:hypothetical protein
MGDNGFFVSFLLLSCLMLIIFAEPGASNLDFIKVVVKLVCAAFIRCLIVS